ncbi:hypothetical protein [Aromatoleum anaerobium]|uniref:DUF2188 domain-containing protein n=1 Tax=Aromatoleum anaerobium TaxID=182180 RepID=A0ABX1PLY4_9RHOO|nr:hypothetical protein [Aromatoleum anaerobium]MCK0506498.1 hypothetical protein [Aromatoleum anaerobium]
MNALPISQARDADLRFSQKALERAAARASQMAAQTGTALIVFRNGRVETIQPAGGHVSIHTPRTVKEPESNYGDKS